MSEPLTTVSDNSEMYVYFSINENNLLNMAREYGTLEKALEQMPDIQLKLSDGTIYNQTGGSPVSAVSSTKTPEQIPCGQFSRIRTGFFIAGQTEA